MSKCTATASTIQGNAAIPVLLLAFELGESAWLLGFSTGFGEKLLRRKIASRDTTTLLREIAHAKQHFEIAADAGVQSCYEAGRDGTSRTGEDREILGSGSDVPHLPPGAREARSLEGAVRSCFDLATRELRGSCDRRRAGDTDRKVVRGRSPALITKQPGPIVVLGKKRAG